MTTSVLAFGLEKRFGGAKVLDGVDLSIQGGLTAVLGPNGAGKSTLLRCLATVMAPDGGSMLIDGLDPSFESDRIEIRRRIGYLPQAHGLAGPNRVFDTLDYLAVLKQCGDARTRRRMIFDALDRVGLADCAAVPISDLSGGMQQRLGLAQSLLAAPTLLVLDEPAASLDPDERFRLREIVAERRHRSTVILSTHLTDEVTHCDKVIVLAAGRVRFVGPPSRLAEVAKGSVWRQSTKPDGARAAWLQADGSYRCLGRPPAGAEPLAPTMEDGYLVLVSSHIGSAPPRSFADPAHEC